MNLLENPGFLAKNPNESITSEDIQQYKIALDALFKSLENLTNKII